MKIDVFHSLGWMEEKEDNLDQAKNYYLKGIREFDNSNELLEDTNKIASTMYNLAVLYGENGDYKKENKLYERAIKIDPKYPDPYSNLAFNYLEGIGVKQNYQTAVEYGADDYLTKPLDFSGLKEKILSL